MAEPLQGLRLLVTRPEGKTEAMARRLESLGASVTQEPLTRTCELDEADYGPLDRAIAGIDAFDWVLFTSAEGVRYFLRRAQRAPGTAPSLGSVLPPSVRLAVIGPKTAEAAAAAGRPPDLVPADYRAEGLVAAFRQAGFDLEGTRFLLVRAREGRDVVPRELEAAGGRVDLAMAYRTEAVPGAAARAAARLRGGEVDMIIATSGAALDELASALAAQPGATGGVRVAALGPVTADRARFLGFEVALVAPEATVESLVQALVAYCAH